MKKYGIAVAVVAFAWCYALGVQEPPAPYSVGQHFILALPEGKTTKELNEWLEQCRPSGVMLRPAHCSDRKKTKKLVEQLQKTAAKIGIPPLIVAVDWEGGIVSRMHEEGGFISVPSPYASARGGRTPCFCEGMNVGKQLHDIYVNCDLAPSADLFNKDIPTLATRCFSDDPDIVASDAIAFAHGLLSQGVVPVIKHFPGLGLGVGDTHLEGVTVALDDGVFKRQTQPFFTALKAGLPCVMSGHLQCAQCDNVPATLSKKAIEMLKQANPDVLCITDDFSMKGVKNALPPEGRVITSLQAGYHLIIYTGTMQEELELLNAIRCVQEQKPAIKELCKQWALEAAQLKEKLFGGVVSSERTTYKFDPEILGEKLARAAVAITNRRNRLFSRGGKAEVHLITVDLPKIRPSEQWFIDQERKSYLSRTLTFMTGRTVNEHVLNPCDDQSVAQLEQILRKSGRHDDIVLQTFFFGNGGWNEVQTMWLEAVERKIDPKRVTLFSLGHPSEQAAFPKATHVQLGSFHNPMIDAALYWLSTGQTITGAQKLAWHPECYLKDKRFGLLCHKASCVMMRGQQKFLPDVLYPWARQQNDQTRLVALFSPEHGLQGMHSDGATISSEMVSTWGCPVYSLHGANRQPSAEMLKGLDLLVIDLQDVGVRCYTYLSTLLQMLEEAQKQDLEVLVLDRPNPIGFWDASGPMLDPMCESFVGKVYTKFLYGSTIGQLAKEINKSIGARLTVLELANQQGSDCYFHEQFVPTSPNLATLEAVYVYPMTVFIEGTNYSEGRGTAYPFQQIGAPWVDGKALAQALNNKKCSGIYFESISFTPQTIKGKAENPKHGGTVCHGVFVHIIDARNVNPTKVGRTILETLFEMYPEQSEWTNSGKRHMIDLLVGTPDWRAEISANQQARSRFLFCPQELVE
ncbi:MAG: exo-beta-N-acetylmuramidase NamZ domain-containing protein [Candidatus Babeliales bacterium]